MMRSDIHESFWKDLLSFSSQLFKETPVIKANLWWADFWHQQHVPLFTDMSVIDHYVISQSIELANNMTYMREDKPLGAS